MVTRPRDGCGLQWSQQQHPSPVSGCSVSLIFPLFSGYSSPDHLLILWVPWWFPTNPLLYSSTRTLADSENGSTKWVTDNWPSGKSDKISIGWLTLKPPLRNTVAIQPIKQLLMVTWNAGWEYNLRRSMWRVLRSSVTANEMAASYNEYRKGEKSHLPQQIWEGQR